MLVRFLFNTFFAVMFFTCIAIYVMSGAKDFLYAAIVIGPIGLITAVVPDVEAQRRSCRNRRR